MTTFKLGRRVAIAAVYFERYGLSLIFFCLAGLRWHDLVAQNGPERALIASSPLIEILRQVIWMQLYLCAGLLLLLGRRVLVPPQNMPDIIVPLGTTFFFIIYYALPWFPDALKKNLCPSGWQAFCVTTGLLFNLAGLAIAVWGTVHLGRSFGVLIEVRKVVLDGAYRWVRHPVYLGYLLFLAGFALANFSLGFFILVPIHIAWVLYRARLEEVRLAESSPEYREYQKHTGFIFPRIQFKK